MGVTGGLRECNDEFQPFQPNSKGIPTKPVRNDAVFLLNWNQKDEEIYEMSLELTSTAFGAGESIPIRYTCDGEDVSPPLAWRGVPPGAQSLVLICDDPDSRNGPWSHWVLYDIPADKGGLQEDVPPGFHHETVRSNVQGIGSAMIFGTGTAILFSLWMERKKAKRRRT